MRAAREYDEQMTTRDDPNGSEPSGTSELDRFQALVKKLVSVPKSEVDKVRAKAKTQRAKPAR